MSTDKTHEGERSCVKVALRVRPLENNGDRDVTSLHVLPDIQCHRTVEVGTKGSGKKYSFDHVLPSSTNQEEVYSKCVEPLIYSCLEGYNATILAYGQTGSGKTHTIIGDYELDKIEANAQLFQNDDDDDGEEDGEGNIDGDGERNVSVEGDQTGVLPRSLNAIFSSLEQKAKCKKQNAKVSDVSQQLQLDDDNICESNVPLLQASSLNVIPFEYSIKVQFMELYGEDILDLITTESKTPSDWSKMDAVEKCNTSNSSVEKRKKKLKIRDGKDGEDAEVIGICQAKVKSAEEALRYLSRGMKMRHTAFTAMNAQSSRSHAIFTVLIQQTQRETISTGSDTECSTTPGITVGMKTSKIHFVDLAGSERLKRTKSKGTRMQEGIDINKGLFVLGNVISALADEKKDQTKYVPYRDSKLTRMLKGSLGGNHKTLMIACTSAAESNTDETMSTLKYADRVKSIKNHAKINIDPSSRVINNLRSQVTALATELLRIHSTLTIDVNSDDEQDSPFTEEVLNSILLTSGLGQDKFPRLHLTPASNNHLTPQDSDAIPFICSQSFDALHNIPDEMDQIPEEPITSVEEKPDDFSFESSYDDTSKEHDHVSNDSIRKSKLNAIRSSNYTPTVNHMTQKSIRSTWRDSLQSIDSINLTETTEELSLHSIDDDTEEEYDHTSMYFMPAFLLVSEATKGSNNGSVENQRLKNSLRSILRNSSQVGSSLLDSEKNLDESSHVSMDEKEQIEMYDSMRASLRVILESTKFTTSSRSIFQNGSPERPYQTSKVKELVKMAIGRQDFIFVILFSLMSALILRPKSS